VTDQTPIDRIPLAHSVHYAARGLPEVPNQYGPGVLRPSEITLTYRSAPDSQLGRVHAYVAGRIWVDGKEQPLLPGGLFGQHYFDGLDGWPEWLAEEARLHDPDAAKAADPTAGLSVQHADALWDAVAIPGPRTPTFTEQHERVCRVVAGIIDGLTCGQAGDDQADLHDSVANALATCQGGTTWGAMADAVLAVLPAPTDRATALREAAAVLDQRASGIDALSSSDFDEEARAVRELADAANELRRMADEAHPAEAWDVPDARPGTTDHTLTQRPASQAPWGVCPDCRAAAGPDCDCPPLDEQPADEAQQDGAQR
jgi:hypothetical protein